MPVTHTCHVLRRVCEMQLASTAQMPATLPACHVRLLSGLPSGSHRPGPAPTHALVLHAPAWPSTHSRARAARTGGAARLQAHSDDEEEEENAGGAEGDEGEEEEEYHDDVDGERPNWHVDREKLTTAQRNKRARQRAREQEEREAKAKRRREKQLERVDSLLGEIKNEGKHLRTKQAKEAAIEVARPKKLGGKRHVPPRPDVLLTEEQPSALRQLATEGSLLGERFDSMQARNLIEVRAKQPRRSHKGPRRTIPAEIGKALRYKSPHYKGPLPAWL